jgi:hypothetical protein
MSPRLADRLAAARQRRFVGREAEKSLFQSALSATEPPFYVLYVCGPGGIGKTSLLREYVSLAQERGARALYLDARNIEPTPEAFLTSLTIALGVLPGESPVDYLTTDATRTVLIIDTYETLTPLEVWLRDVFLPQLPSSALVVFASRVSPSDGWRAEPGWSSLLRILPLRNLTPDESRALLKLRTVPTTEHDQIIEFTHGHPLAVSLVADVLDQQPDVQFQPQNAPDIMRMLLSRLVQDAPTTDHRAALEACALVRHMNEALLEAMLQRSNVHALFEWLRSLSFMETGRYGIFPHDLVRDTLAADLRWRHLDWFNELHRRARHYFHDHLRQTQGQSQRRILTELVYLHRDNPVVAQFFEFKVNDAVWTDLAHAEDLPTLLEMVRTHEGEESAHWAEFWFQRQPGAILVIRDNQRLPMGFMMSLSLSRAQPQEIMLDPATRMAWEYLQRNGPLRAGEEALYFRFWMDGAAYQALSTIQSRIFLNMVQQYLNVSGLAFTFLPCSDPDFYAAPFAYADLARLPDADFASGGRRFGLYGHDWRVMPPAAWLEMLGAREIAAPTASPGQPIPAPAMSQPVLVLSEPDFAEAVRDALRHFTRADALRDNPLLRSRLVIDRTGATASASTRAQALQSLIREAFDLLQSNPRQAKLHRALYHTYIQPAATQELAAELLDLPFSTYRRHLKEGIENVTETLWQSELGAINV